MSEDAAKGALEARMLVENPLYESYREDLQGRLDKAVETLLKPGTARDHIRMVRLAGEAAAFKHALGLPNDLMGDPEAQEPTP